MAKQYTLPPILGNSNTQNVTELRNFLVRLVNELNRAEETVTSSGTYKIVNGKRVYTQGGASAEDSSKVIQNIAALKSLIVKTAQDLGANIVSGDNYVMNYTNAQIDGLDAKMQETYVAQSDFGTFVEGVDRRIVNTARDTVESYGYSALISSAQNTADEAQQLIQNYSTTIDSQIRRGLVLDPDTGEYVTGIAIAQNLQFTGEVQTGTDGQQYYKMETGQTFGLYTSTGWQFWIDGHKKGWYNSLDGMLHIANVLIENTLQFGDSVQMIVDASGKFGMKMIRSSS